MSKTIPLGLLLVLLAAACTSTPPVNPSFDELFPPVSGDLMTISSPSLADLDGDGVPDIVFGTGVDRTQPSGGHYVIAKQPEISGYVVAVSGSTDKILWQVPDPRDAFTTPRFADLNGDGVPDVIMGGREGSFAAFSGKDGSVLWHTNPASVAKTPALLYFTTPALIPDANGDGVPDLVVVYGGDALKLPGTPRPPSYLAAISGKDGSVLASQVSPDSAEMYSSVVVYDRPDGRKWMVFGTGGETASGAAYRAPVSSLLDGTFRDSVQELCEHGTKGVIAPATLVDVNGDGELDIVLSTFDGRLIVVDGKSGNVLWKEQDPGEETYHSAAVVRKAGGGLGLFVSRGVGTFPKYTGSVHRLFDATTGKVLYKYQDQLSPAGAPLAVDLDGDGVDEPIFFSTPFPKAQGGRIYVLDVAGHKLLDHDLGTTFWSTPVIADPRHTGTLEMIGLSWSQAAGQGAASWRDLHWHLLRMNLNAKTPEFRGWAGYMGTQWNGIWEPPAK